MQFLVNVIDDGQASAAGRTESASDAEAAAVDAFNDRLRADGHWVLACGLSDPNEAVVIDARTASPSRSDGPLQHADEYVAGFWVLDVADEETALRLASEGSAACNRKVELRRILG